ncbi:hypothetical protein PR048_032111 [Dryococelus australis]|uniref:Uncharacterized protein n=1 Tax=Dryococelus australis TaxID=614101 RepID=A0ABQ9G259_9NEOP|nr:hypothetical protein PR048_032111 [Dryococelus australis]
MGQRRNARGKREIPEETRQPSSGTILFAQVEGEHATVELHAALREHCSEVHSLARRGDGALVKCANVTLIAPVLLGRRAGPLIRGDGRCKIKSNYRLFTPHTPPTCWNSVRQSATGNQLASRHPQPIGNKYTDCSRIFLRLMQTKFNRVGAAVAERLACSPPTKANRVRFPGRSAPVFYASGNRAERCRWSGGFSRGSPVSPALSFRRCSVIASFHPHRLSIPHLLGAAQIFQLRRGWSGAGMQGRGKRECLEKACRHDTHMRQHRSEPSGYRTRIAVVGGERPSHCATAAPNTHIQTRIGCSRGGGCKGRRKRCLGQHGREDPRISGCGVSRSPTLFPSTLGRGCESPEKLAGVDYPRRFPSKARGAALNAEFVGSEQSRYRVGEHIHVCWRAEDPGEFTTWKLPPEETMVVVTRELLSVAMSEQVSKQNWSDYSSPVTTANQVVYCGRVKSRVPHVANLEDVAATLLAFSGCSHVYQHWVLLLLHIHLTSSSSALPTSRGAVSVWAVDHGVREVLGSITSILRTGIRLHSKYRRWGHTATGGHLGRGRKSPGITSPHSDVTIFRPDLPILAIKDQYRLFTRTRLPPRRSWFDTGGLAPRFSHMRTVLDDAACRRVFSGYSRLPYRSILGPHFLSCSVMTNETYGSQLQSSVTRRVLLRPGFTPPPPPPFRIYLLYENEELANTRHAGLPGCTNILLDPRSNDRSSEPGSSLILVPMTKGCTNGIS